MRTYTTVQGDKWDSIAYKLYGDTKFTDALISANFEYRMIYIFSAGTVLEIPEVEERVSVESLPPWKRVSG
ncbi:MAG: phage tail protein [Ruminiclostridium sp.]|nr:phage tail protein [Ruminiclostridium sp.]